MEDSIRICLVSFFLWPSIGGAQVRAEKLARQLQALGYDVTVVTFRHDRQWERKEMLDGLPVVRVGGIYRRDGHLSTGRLGYLPASIAMFLTLWRLRHSAGVVAAAAPVVAARVAAVCCRKARLCMRLIFAVCAPARAIRT